MARNFSDTQRAVQRTKAEALQIYLDAPIHADILALKAAAAAHGFDDETRAKLDVICSFAKDAYMAMHGDLLAVLCSPHHAKAYAALHEDIEIEGVDRAALGGPVPLS
jgi:hypothetical protein